MDKEFVLKSLYTLTKVEFFEVSTDGKLLSEESSHNPISCSEELRKELIKGCQAQDIPFLKLDGHGVLWCCIYCGGAYIMCGPVTMCAMNMVERHRFYHSYHIQEKYEKNITFMNFSEYLVLLELLCQILLNKKYEDGTLVFGNGLSVYDLDEMRIEQVRERHQGIHDGYHHTYQEEKRIWDYMQLGDADKVYHWNYRLLENAGKLSDDTQTHWYNMSIVAITLCTRAAVESGLPPAEAYKISDFYIRKLNIKDDIVQIQNVLNNAMMDLADKIKVMLERRKYSNYVEQCKDYIAKHYREKILIEDISQAMGISSGYLSKLFKKETGVTWQEYIIQFRIERAANMLRYSDETIAYISDYINFPSQSYFGEKFKKYMKMTPREYREKYKPSEF